MHIESHKFSDTLQSVGGGIIFNLTHLHCTKYSVMQKHVSHKKDINSINIFHTGLHKKFLIH